MTCVKMRATTLNIEHVIVFVHVTQELFGNDYHQALYVAGLTILLTSYWQYFCSQSSYSTSFIKQYHPFLFHFIIFLSHYGKHLEEWCCLTIKVYKYINIYIYIYIYIYITKPPKIARLLLVKYGTHDLTASWGFPLSGNSGSLFRNRSGMKGGNSLWLFYNLNG